MELYELAGGFDHDDEDDEGEREHGGDAMDLDEDEEVRKVRERLARTSLVTEMK